MYERKCKMLLKLEFTKHFDEDTETSELIYEISEKLKKYGI
jgi:hypothetical protein